MSRYAPGSFNALQHGCKCSVTANHMGLGVADGTTRYYNINPECKYHETPAGHYISSPPESLAAQRRRVQQQRDRLLRNAPTDRRQFFPVGRGPKSFREHRPDSE